MSRIIVLLLPALCCFAMRTAAQTWSWKQHAANTQSSGVAAADNGGVYHAAQFTIDISLGSLSLSPYPGRQSFYLVKYDTQGNAQWAQKLGVGSHSDPASAFVSITSEPASGNVYVAGYFSGSIETDFFTLTSKGGTDLFILMFNSLGVLQWVKQEGGTGSEYLAQLTADNSGNLVVTGTYETSAAIGSATYAASKGSNFFIAKYDNSGNYQWSHSTLRGSFMPREIDTDDAGNIYLFGFAGMYTTAGDTVQFERTSVITGDWYGDVVLVKYGTQGACLYVQDLASSYTGFNHMTADPAGNVYLSKNDRYNSFHLYKYDPGFRQVFYTKAPGKWVYCSGMTTDSQGNLYIYGDFMFWLSAGNSGDKLNGYGSTPSDARFVAKMSSGTQWEWAEQCQSQLHNIAVAGTGDVYVAAGMQDSVMFGNKVFVSQGPGAVLGRIAVNDALAAEPVANKAASTLNIYPNPANSTLHVQCTLPSRCDLQVSITNVEGQEIHSEMYSQAEGDWKHTFDMGSHAKGIYLVELVSDGKKWVERVVLE